MPKSNTTADTLILFPNYPWITDQHRKRLGKLLEVIATHPVYRAIAEGRIEEGEVHTSTALAIAIMANNQEAIRKYGTSKACIWLAATMAGDIARMQGVVISDVKVIAQVIAQTWLLAAEYGQVEVLEYLAKDPSTKKDATNQKGNNAWIMAAANGQVEVMEYLAKDSSTKKDATDQQGNNAWILAAANGRVEVLKYLALDPSTKKDATNQKGNNAWIMAAASGQVEVMEYLAKDSSTKKDATDQKGNNTWIVAAASGRVEALEYLAKDPSTKKDAANPHGWNAWLSAAANDRVEVLKYLWENGVSQAQLDNGLEAAIQKNHLEARDFLLLKGANPKPEHAQQNWYKAAKQSDALYNGTPVTGNAVAFHMGRLQERLLSEGVAGSSERFVEFIAQQASKLVDGDKLKLWVDKAYTATLADVGIMAIDLLEVSDAEKEYFLPITSPNYQNIEGRKQYFEANPQHEPFYFLANTLLSHDSAKRTAMVGKLIALGERGEEFVTEFLPRLLLPQALRTNAKELIKVYQASKPLFQPVISEMQAAIGDLQESKEQLQAELAGQQQLIKTLSDMVRSLQQQVGQLLPSSSPSPHPHTDSVGKRKAEELCQEDGKRQRQ